MARPALFTFDTRLCNVSCLAKFFNIALNNRIKKVSEKIISLIQAGFRPGLFWFDTGYVMSVYSQDL